MKNNPWIYSERLAMCGPDSCLAPRLSDFLCRNREFFQPWFPVQGEDFYTAAWHKRKLQMNLLSMAEGRSHHTFLFELNAHKQNPKEAPIIGQVNLTGIVRGAFQSGFLGYHLDQEYNGKGLMTEAIRTLVGIWFGELNLHRIEANVIPSNRRSTKMIAGLGFEKEGVSRDYLRIDGNWQDHEHWVLLNKQWKESVR